MLEYLGKQTLKEVNHLPNIISSVRSVKTDAERRAKNFAVKSAVRTASRKLIEAVEAGKADEAKALLIEATKTIKLLLKVFSIKMLLLAENPV